MSVQLVVGGVTYDYPTINDELWGGESTDWAIAVTSELSQVAVVGDIGPTTLVTITNGQTLAANVTGLVLNPADIRAGIVEYYVDRTWDSGSLEVAEVGHLYLLYKDQSATWTIAQVGNDVGSTGVTFSITAGGQVQYVSDTVSPSTGYSGLMKYRLRVLQKT